VDKKRILFVDDEPLLLEALKRSLRGYRSRWDMSFFDRPHEALDAFNESPFDVVVSDISMPRMTGLELAKKVKEVSPDTQVIILTGKGSLNSAMAAINDLDIYRYYTKPCQVLDLVAAIDASLLKNDGDEVKRGRANGSDSSLGEAALNLMPIGVIVADRDARVTYMNPLAAEIVAARDGLVVSREDILLGERPEDSQSLKNLIGEIVEEGGRTSRGIALSRPSMQRPLSVLVSRLEDGRQDGHNVILYVTNPEQRFEVSPELVGRLFDLTSSESRLVSHMASGDSLDETAEKMNVTVGTARTYLKQVFSKTGTRRQAELMRLVLTSPALIRTPSD